MSDLEATAREAIELFGYWQDPNNGWTPDDILREVEEKWPVLARGVLELLEERDRLWKCVERNERLWRSEAEYYPDARELRQTRLDRAEMCREALAPKGEGEG